MTEDVAVGLLDSDPVEHDTQIVQAQRRELVERIARAVREDGVIKPLPGLTLFRFSAPIGGRLAILDPAFCMIAQGSKEIHLAEEHYRYDPYRYLLSTVGLPVVGQVIEASRERPYLALRLELDPILVGSVMVGSGYTASARQSGVRAMAVSPLDVNLLDAVLRMVRLVNSPTEATFLMPLITREIVYRLLTGEQGDRLRHIAVVGGYGSPISRAIERLRQDFNEPLRIESLASEMGMSVSGFHHHFKAVTAMSPLQFQKQMRLQEARRLMLSEGLDAASAAYRVGYGDASQFNREYKRLMGLPPMRDVERLREPARQDGGLAAG